PGQLRLLRPHVVGVRPRRCHAPAVEQPAGARRHAGVVERDAAGRPRLLLPAGQPRRHLRGRREVHQRAPVRRRRALPERLPSGLLRRPAPLIPPRPRPLPRGPAADPAWSAAALDVAVGRAAASVRTWPAPCSSRTTSRPAPAASSATCWSWPPG